MNTTDTSHASNALAAALAGGLGLFAMLVVFAVLIFSFYIYWRIAAKAGYNGAVSLLLLVPLVNVVAVIYFAFSEWPIETELARLRSGWRPEPGLPSTGTSITAP
ncbi:MAG: hypothetical protein ACLPYS_15435 [Vulcanimicrobiaceae bacterium]